MSVYIQNIATCVPKTCLEQSLVREKMEQYVGNDPFSRRIIHRIYTHSGIEKRHTVINDFHSNGHPKFFFKDDGLLGNPSTKMRNEIYTHCAKSMFVQTAEKLLKKNPAAGKDQITHVITASCTGFFAPDPAFYIVKEAGLSASVQRFHIGFMGCFAAFPALKMAQTICRADPDAVVMIVCVELCSLHLQDSTETDQLISASVFADGAAGAIISSREPSQEPVYALESFQTAIAPNSEGDMAWTIGDTGFEMVLSTAVPEIIEDNLASSVSGLLGAYDLDIGQINHWAVHPGGRAILDRAENQLKLSPEQITSSRHVLSQYGNMSSATILFVLEELLNLPGSSPEEKVLAMAFGPGLTIESGYLTKLS